MRSSNLVHVIGSAGHAKVVVATLLDAGYDVDAIFDDDPSHWGKRLSGIAISGPVDSIKHHKRLPAVIAASDNRVRKAIAEQYDLDWLTVIHPQASVDCSVDLGRGTVVFSGAVIQPDTQVGDHAIIGTSASIDQDCVVGSFAHIATGSRLAGDALVGDGAFLGAGSTVAPSIRIAPWAIVRAGDSVLEQARPEVAIARMPTEARQSYLTRDRAEEEEDAQHIQEAAGRADAEGHSADASDRIYLSPPHMTPESRELLLNAFDSNWIAPFGPHVDEFEKEFAAKIGVPHAIAVSSATAGLHLALLALGVGKGDEVLASTLTFVAMINAIAYVGAKPVFIDSDRETWNMDPDLLAEELEIRAKQGRLPKAVLVVDVYGQCADYERIVKACRFYDVPLIEDAAEALGASYQGRPAGTFGEIGVFSFNGNKIVTTSSGGMLVTEREDLAQHVRFLANQARDPVLHYEHSAIGYNYRMSNLLAAVGRGQLDVLEERVKQRRANHEAYREAIANLPGIHFMPEIPDGHSTRWLTCISVDPDEFGATAEEIRLMHDRQNIESRRILKPMHLQSVFADCQVVGGCVAEDLFNHGLCLPSGSNLSSHQRERVTGAIRRIGKVAQIADTGRQPD